MRIPSFRIANVAPNYLGVLMGVLWNTRRRGTARAVGELFFRHPRSPSRD
jgi:hypothetical protein